MLYEKIMRASKALKKIESLPPEEQSIMDLARSELMDAADQAQELEQNAPVNGGDSFGPAHIKPIPGPSRAG